MSLSRPKPGEVQIILFNLDLAEAEVIELERLLSPDELKRANRLFTRQLRNRFISGRGLLRETLADYLDLEASRLILSTTPSGKPHLSCEHDCHDLDFNLSHSGDLAILALASQCQVGIDLEQVREDLPYQKIAWQFFSDREQSDLFSLPVEQQLAAFYRCWTRKESYLKACGSGFTYPSDNFDISLLPGQPPALLAHRTDPEQTFNWSMLDLNVPHGNCAALTAQGARPSINYLQNA